MTYMRLDNIKIKDSFAITTPKDDKISACRKYWELYGKQDRYIEVDHNNTLVDGYIQYLILKEAGIDIAEIKITDKKQKKRHRKNRKPRMQKSKNLSYRECKTIYVFGTLVCSKSKKERVWRIPNSWNKDRVDRIKPGSVILVHNQKNVSWIKVTRIEELSECPIDIPVKKVI